MSDRKERRPWPVWAIFLVGTLAVALLVGGIYSVSRPVSVHAKAESLHLPGHVDQPEWMPVAAPSVKTAYAWAAEHYDELRYIPCWCGCDGEHTNNFECYWDHDGNGKVTGYDSHAYG